MRRTALVRHSRLRSLPKPKGTDLVASAAWIAAVVHPKAECIVCGREKDLQGHHIIEQQVISRLCRGLGMSGDEEQSWLWDERVGCPIHAYCHARHTSAFLRIPRERLPTAVFAYAREFDSLVPNGAEPMLCRLEREYP